MMAEKCLFFAEDVFGNQFGIKQNRIVSFEAETGMVEEFADSIAEWTSKILEDFDYLTGHSLAHAWQSLHTTLATTDRLLPKIPFMLGGEYAVENLYSVSGVKAMQWQGHLATQLRDFPDGTTIELRVVD